MQNAKDGKPRKIIIKSLTSERSFGEVFDFFENVKNMESGGALKSITKGADGWWECDTPVGKAKIKTLPNRESGILDHIFVGGGIEWNVFVRIVPNQEGSTTTWTFIKPDGLTDDQFEEQLKNFDIEIVGWKNTIASTHN